MAVSDLRSHRIRQTQISRAPVRKSMDMNRVASIILGGGQGTRLFPLTVTRCKPAISFGGNYRLIDIPMSNSINSGCLKIFIVTQFLSSSLHQHIFKTYRLGTFSSGFIELLPAEEKPTASHWFQGPADAVRQNIEYFLETPVDYFLILSGDQLYNMNFQDMLQFARKTKADLTIATLPVNEAEATRMGLLKIDKHNFITDFSEKPVGDELLKMQHHRPNDDPYYLGSMGIYLFKRDTLFKLLAQDPREDFGKHLIPTKVREGNVAAYIHHGYWEDIGTIDSFYKANIALTKPHPEFNWYDEENKIFNSHCNLPGPKIYNTRVSQAILCEGSIIEAAEITNSILGPRSIVQEGTIIRNSYIMGNDFYAPPVRSPRLPNKLQIGKNCLIHGAIIDKHAKIGNNVRLINKNQLTHFNSDDVYIRDGIIIVTRGACLPDGFTL